jgi:hypothetical protein
VEGGHGHVLVEPVELVELVELVQLVEMHPESGCCHAVGNATVFVASIKTFTSIPPLTQLPHKVVGGWLGLLDGRGSIEEHSLPPARALCS